jgi:hypothetical protein
VLLLDQDACGAGVPKDAQDVSLFNVAKFIADQDGGDAGLLGGFERILVERQNG